MSKLSYIQICNFLFKKRMHKISIIYKYESKFNKSLNAINTLKKAYTF